MSEGAANVKPSRHVYVFTVEHGVQQKYKLVVKGELRQLGTRKMKRYLQRATGVPAANQRIFFGSEEIEEDWNGDDIGLYHGAELFMEVVSASLARQRSRPHLQEPPCCGEERGSGNGSVHRAAGSSEAATNPSRGTTATVSVPPDSRATSRCLSFPNERATSSVPGAQRCHSQAVLTTTASPTGGRRSTREGGGAVLANPTGAARLAAVVEYEDVRLPPHAHARDRHSSGSSAHPVGTEDISSLAWIASHRNSSSSVRRSDRPSTSFSSRPSTSQRDPRLSLLEAENDAMQRENALLRSKILEVERRAASAAVVESEAHLQEQIEELQDALLEKEAETEEAVRDAGERARLKEEELVRELDTLREERRRMRREQAALEQQQRAAVEALQAQLRAQQAEVRERDEIIQQFRQNLAGYQSRRSSLSPLSPASAGARGGGSPPKPSIAKSREEMHNMPLSVMVQASLDRLSLLFNAAELALDENNTCMLQVETDDLTRDDTVNLLVTLDPVTERLYLYAPVLTHLPGDAATRLRLYERLLEGSLLGKDMAGCGVGVSAESGLVLMSTSIDVRRSDPSALAAAARPFVSALRDWTCEAERLITAPDV